MCYVRGESTFSDHRPVYSIFSAQVNLRNYPNATPVITRKPMIPSSASADLLLEKSAVLPSPEEEEFFLVGRTQSCIQTAPRFSITAQK